MKSKFISLQVLVAAIIVLISGTSTIAQTLHQDWTRTETGAITNLQNMTVLESGERYVVEDTGDGVGTDGFNVVKYNDAGVLVWRTLYSPRYEGVYKPVATAYNAGAIFVLCNVNNSDGNVVKFSGDDGSQIDENGWGGPFTHRSRGIVADPLGAGVIVTYVIRYTDPGAWGERQYQMVTFKYDADLVEVWPRRTRQFLGLLEGYQNPTPTPRTITADSDGSTYITGVLDVEAGPSGPPYLTGAASAFTLKYNSLGELQWLHKITEPSITNYGYDNDDDATGTYMVHQRASSHYDDGPPLLTGRTVLTKRNLLDGTVIWTQPLPGVR